MVTSSPTTNAFFRNAHDVVFHNPTIVDSSSHVKIKVNEIREKPGLRDLLNHSMRDAFHDSSGRWPPPRCHYGTRQDIITGIVDWGHGLSEHPEFLLWMHGPFGVGKSAIAQSCAEELAAQNHLGASLFFSRPNKRNDPNRIFTSIAYQIATKCPEICDILDRAILNDPSLLTASLPVQFEELLVKPIHQIKPDQAGIEGWVIVVDGLDECSRRTDKSRMTNLDKSSGPDGFNAQLEFIKIIATSIRDKTTPFRWFITSRPEPHIEHRMESPFVSSILYSLDLPLSPKDDHDILTFFVKELNKISEQHGLSATWHSEADVAVLVKLTAGLWVYAATVARFIGSPMSLGPVSQLRLVLSLGRDSESGESKPTNPLTQLDLFYHLIMQQVPSSIVSTVQKILLLNWVYGAPEVDKVLELANVFELSEEEFRVACGFLRSVLRLDDSDKAPIKFYHSSFMEFMEDWNRSKEFCIYKSCLAELRQEVLGRINRVHSQIKGKGDFKILLIVVAFFDLSSTFPEGLSVNITAPLPFSHADNILLVYHSLIQSLIRLCDSAQCTITPSFAASLQKFPFPLIGCVLKDSPFGEIVLNWYMCKRNLPQSLADKIIRSSRNPLYYFRRPSYARFDRPILLGNGKHKLVCWQSDLDYVLLVQVQIITILSLKLCRLLYQDAPAQSSPSSRRLPPLSPSAFPFPLSIPDAPFLSPFYTFLLLLATHISHSASPLQRNRVRICHPTDRSPNI
ncbi:hypothetical protein D9756_008303 [Leucocoprinus leucothites]|uniref:Nephrocystin 3-like N-terminal domain-containing protein n=1 Tax=Leucocoprinus leucothites TaxID=201217 RepID=A0A8H5D083_9AGAR|nr:hypothetical protein D9756_008303 [Leucoagaricus leucothites]